MDLKPAVLNGRFVRLEPYADAAHRVDILTDARNLRSQAAIRKLGAIREGVLRRNKRTWTGYMRDTVVFSILAEEWPAVRAGLDARLATHAGTV